MSQTKAQLIDNLVQPITGALGSASAPTFSFTSNPNTGLYSPGADQLALSTGGTERLRITSDGTLRLYNSPGIDFSQIQTNAAGVTSETLDSYEEGTWTPSFAFATSGSVTYSLQVGEYVKIGNTVTVRGGIGLSAISAPTGSVTIAGLPFTSANRPNNVSSATIGIARAFTSAGLPLAIYNNANFNILLISKNATNTNFVALQGSDLAATTALYFTITYGV